MSENEAKKKGIKKLPIIIAVIIVLVISSVCYLIAMGIIPMPWSNKPLDEETFIDTMPEKLNENAAIDQEFFNVAHERTIQHIMGAQTTLPKMKNFSDVPSEHDVTMGLNSINPEFFGFLSGIFEPFIGSEVNLVTQLDMQGKKMSVAPTILTPMHNFTDYQLFLSENLVALKMPDIYDKKEYITVNPKTFTEDYKNSFYSKESVVGETPDLSQLMDILAGAAENSDDSGMNTGKFSSDTILFIEELSKKAIFKDEGKDSDGNQLISYTLKSGDIEEFIKHEAELYDTLVVNAINDRYGDLNSADEIKNMKEQFTYYTNEWSATMDIPDDLVITYTINEDQFITKVESNTFKLFISPEYLEESFEITVSLVLELNGKDNLSDDISMAVIMEVDGSRIIINAHETLKNDNDRFGRKISFDVRQDDITRFSMAIDYIWNSEEKETDNFNAKFNFVLYNDLIEESQLIDIDIIGMLSETADEIALTNGLIHLHSGELSIANLNLEYSVSKIDAVLEPAQENSISFFDIPEADFSDMTEALSAIASIFGL